MEVIKLAPDIHVAVGAAYRANSTVLVRGSEVLLIDGMGSRADADELRRWIEIDLQKAVRFIVSSHYFSDHLAALALFPRAEVIAHALHLHTWSSERFRSVEEEQHFAPPSITFNESMTIRWGIHTLELFHNPGHTMSTIGIDIPTADLLHAGDTIVGNMAYIAYSTPELIALAIDRLRRRSRRVVLTSHGSARDSIALSHASAYIRTLAAKSARAFAAGGEENIKSIRLDDCLPAGVPGTAFENRYHVRNLETIVEKKFFAFEREAADTAVAHS